MGDQGAAALANSCDAAEQPLRIASALDAWLLARLDAIREPPETTRLAPRSASWRRGRRSTDIRTNVTTYHDRGRPYEGFVAAPSEPDQDGCPCVVLAHDWSGLNAGTKHVAERVARLGFVCFAIDVYGQGVRGDERGDNAHLMEPLLSDRGELRTRLLAGLEAARRWRGVDGDRLAALGFCFGGLCAFDLARAAPVGLRGTISVHGVLKPPPLDDSRRQIASSVLLLHGWDDRTRTAVKPQLHG